MINLDEKITETEKTMENLVGQINTLNKQLYICEGMLRTYREWKNQK